MNQYFHKLDLCFRTKRYKHSLSKGPLSLYKRHRVIESVLNECLGLHNKPKAEVHPGHKLMGPEEDQCFVHLHLECLTPHFINWACFHLRAEKVQMDPNLVS